MASGEPVGPGATGSQTADERGDQILLDGPRDLRMRQDLGLCLGEATDLPVQAAQARHMTPRWPQYLPLQRRSDGLPSESAAIAFELPWVDRYHAPGKRSGRQQMQSLTAAAEHDSTCLQLLAM